MNCAFRWRILILAVTLGIICGSANQVWGQAEPTPDLASRIDSLEKQLADLRSQMEAQKAAAAAPTPAAPPPSAAAVLPAAAPATAPAPTGLAGLLGPTTLSGFVDVYYGYNSNQPANRTTALRNFDINSSQFSLNMLELVADKAPDPDRQPPGLSHRSRLWASHEPDQRGRSGLAQRAWNSSPGAAFDDHQLRSIPQRGISRISGSGGQRAADQRREVRYSGGR